MDDGANNKEPGPDLAPPVTIEDLPDNIVALFLSHLSWPDQKTARLVNRKWHRLLSDRPSLPPAVTIEALPDEIIVLFLSYLSLPDRKNARLVSKKWNQLSNAVSLTKNDIYAIDNISQLKNINLNKKFYNLKIKNVSGKTPGKIPEYWIKCGDSVKSIELYSVDLNDSFIWKLLSFTPNLEYLLLSSFDENDQRQVKAKQSKNFENKDTPSFPKLLSLDMLHFSCLSGGFFTKLVANSPKLKRLSLEWIRNDCDGLFPSVEKFLKSQGKDLKELIFSRSSIANNFMGKILPHLGETLTGLYIRQCTGLTADSILPLISKHVPKLKEIDLSYSQFSDLALNLLFTELKHLTHISLFRTLAGDLTIPVFSGMPNLRALELSYSSNVNKHCLEEAFSKCNFAKLTDLRMDKLLVDDALLAVALPNLTFLNYLSLNDCSLLSNKAMRLICTLCVRLRSLSLQNCRKISDLSLIQNLKGLIHLDLYGLKKVKSQSLNQIKLLELQTLDVSKTGVGIENLHSFDRHCRTLQDVYFDFELKYDFKSEKVRYKMHFGFARFRGDPIFDN